MFDISKVGGTIVKATGRPGLMIQKASPEILVGVGIVGAIGATVLACRATLKVEDILDDAKDKLDKIKEAEETQEEDTYSKDDATKDRVIVYSQSALHLAKIYAPSVCLGVFSISCLVGSHNILSKRNAALAAAYKAIDQGFKEYRGRVIDEFGKEKDFEYRFGAKKEEVTVEETDEKGKTKKVKKEILRVDPKMPSMYARCFDDSNPEWKKNAELNHLFIRCQQNSANDILKSQGHLFLNEVYDLLNMPRSSAGAVVGWIYDPENPNRENIVDFGIYDEQDQAKMDFINGYEPNVILDFNVDGVIYDLI